jgi:predicted ester cyclase
MSAENVTVARRWFQEVWNEQKASSITELMHADAIGHTHTGVIKGPAAWKQQFWDPLVGAFSDFKVHVDDVLSDKEAVVVRWHATMEHTGGALGIAASGKPVAISGITWMTIRGGKIVEGWDGWDSTGLIVQCGGATLDPALLL